ncbi:MAG: dephospho-CoA kinase [Pseudorhodobacter sp.]|nr:dephospho-CoA kinase [Rhizobacter sp.]
MDLTATAPFSIGLTGGIGSGKSTVARTLVELGAVLIDSDAIARLIALPGGVAIGPLQAEFGAQALDASGGLNRPRMRELAFADPFVKRRLEAILHPLIGMETERLAADAGDKVRVFDVPLLVESTRWRSRVTKVLVIDCDAATQVARVAQRSGWSEQTVQAVIAQQASREKRRACADAVIYNNGVTSDELAQQVTSLWRQWVVARRAL